MSFWSDPFGDIGGFISQNVTSALSDIGHIGGQVLQYGAPVITALTGIPPQAITGGLSALGNLVGGDIGNAWQAMGQGGQTTAQLQQNQINAQNNANQQQTANNQALYNQGVADAQALANQNTNTNVNTSNSVTSDKTATDTTTGVVNWFKNNWYFIAGCTLFLATTLYFAFRKPQIKRR